MKTLRILTALCACLALQAFAEPAPEPGLPPSVIEPLKAAMEGWDMVHADSLPSVNAGDLQGWRILFAKRFDEDKEKGVSGGRRQRFNHVDLALFPCSDSFNAADVKPKIPWSDAPEEYMPFKLHLGKGGGYEWFCKANIFSQDMLREAMKLQGGDGRMEALIKALDVEDRLLFSSNVAIKLLKRYGKDAVPGIKAALEKALDDDKKPEPYMMALKTLECEAANAALVSYFNAGDVRLTRASSEAMANKPYIKGAKDAYLKMLAAGSHIAPCAEACKQFGWEAEAIPLLERVQSSPSSFSDYSTATVALKHFKSGQLDMSPFALAEQIKVVAVRNGDLEGTPKTMKMGETAGQREARLQDEDKKRLKPVEDALADSKDKDFAIVAAIALCLMKPEKGIAPEYAKRVNESGMRVLSKLPAKDVQAVLYRLSRKVSDGDESAELLKVMRKSQSLAPPLQTAPPVRGQRQQP